MNAHDRHDDIRSVFDRLVVDEPPHLVDATTTHHLAAAGQRRVRRRRTTIGAVAICVAGIAATVALVGPGLVSTRPVDAPPAAPTSAPADFPIPDLHLSGAGERRIAEEMVRRLEAVYPGSEVAWRRVWPRGVPKGPIDPPPEYDVSSWRPRSDVEPRASIRYTVSGQEGYLDLESLWTLSDDDLFHNGMCLTWADCLRPQPLKSTVGGYGSETSGNDTEWSYLVSAEEFGGPSLRVVGTLSVLADEKTAKEITAGDELYVTASDLEQPWPRNDARPAPDAAMTADLQRVRNLGEGWSADLGLGPATPTLFGLVSATPQPYTQGSLTWFSARGSQVLVVRFDLQRFPDTEVAGCDRETVAGQACRELPTDGGTVVLIESERHVSATYVRDDGATVDWTFDQVPNGWTPDELAAYVGHAAVFVEPR